MILQLVFILGLVSVSNGCSTIGPFISNPSFTFSFSPPLGWTFYTPTAGNQPYPGQQTSSSAAQQRMKTDINAAILMAAQQSGVSTIGWSWSISGYNPTSILVVDDSDTDNAVAGTYVPGLGAVLQVRSETASVITKTNYAVSMNIRVTSNNQLFSKSDWETFAQRVGNILSMYYNFVLRSSVTIR